MPEQRTAEAGERYLYLFFDECRCGYSIRRVTLSRRSVKRKLGERDDEHPFSSGSGIGSELLPGVFSRILAPLGLPKFFTAFGTKIMAMHPDACLPGMPGCGRIPMINVQEHSVTYGPPQKYNVFPLFFPIDDFGLFTMDIDSFDLLPWKQIQSEDIGSFDGLLWKPEQSEPREPFVYRNLPYPPFTRYDISSYGVNRDGCILVSTKKGTTFSFDTKGCVWVPYGDWAFPFTDRGHYDTSLKGFVGLSKDPETLGYLYCSTSLHPSPDFKCSKETVYEKNPAERHVSATLLHLSPGTFCLVECFFIDKGRALEDIWKPLTEAQAHPEAWLFWDDPWGAGPQCGPGFMYRLKTFSLEYDAEGDLKPRTLCVDQFKVPDETTCNFLKKDPVALYL